MKLTALALSLLFLAPVTPAGATPWTGDTTEARMAAGAELEGRGLQHEALSVYLDILKTSPGDKRALAALKELTGRAAASYSSAPAAPADGSRLYAALDEAALEMLGEVREPELRLGFAKARGLFNDGRLLLAYDSFLLLESRRPPQEWLRDEIRRYLTERIPRELDKGRVRGFYGINSSIYCRNVFPALARRDWESAYRDLGLWLKISAPARSAQGEKLDKEAKALMARLKDRLSLARTKERGGSWLDEARQAFLKQDYSGAAEKLETFIPAAGSADLASRAWKDLGAAYDYNALLDSIGRTEKAMAGGQYPQAFTLIAEALERYPGSRRMTELRNQLLEKLRPGERARPVRVASAEGQAAGAEGAGAGAAEGAGGPEASAPKRPRPGRQAAKAEAPAPRIPTDAEKTEADELYLQGISAYGTGDLEKARSSWEAALKLVPDHPKSLKAMERVSAETGR